jgi:3-oxoacyl-[acyl-carrier-protein] synthase II
MLKRVVVTGIGIVSPVGHNREDTWRALLAGQSGVDYITRFDASDSPVKIAAEVKHWQPEKYMDARIVRRHDRFQQFIWLAAQEAMRQAHFAVTDANRERTSIIVGSSVGGVDGYYFEVAKLLETGNIRGVTPFGISMLMVNGGADMLSIETKAAGPTYTLASACATGADCIGHAYDLIRLGRIDQALAGCADATVLRIGIGAFDRTGALSRFDGDPRMACRPFDKNRNGLVFGEGAGVLVLEELEHAKSRGAHILAELVGYAATADGFHVTAPHPDALGATRAIQKALDDAHLNPTDVDYISAHGTGTTLNDSTETKAVKNALGEHAYAIPMSSTKSMTGHCMGATAAIEAGLSVLALRDQVVPPTINLNDPDPECDLDYVPNHARQLKLKTVMSNAFGFGGHNAVLLFRSFN